MSSISAAKAAYPQRLQIASDMFAHHTAAFETSGNTEAYLFYEMCRHPEWQTKLREELRTLASVFPEGTEKKIEIEDIPDAKEIESLPILDAIVMETLRVWPAVPGGQPRVVPNSCSLGGFDNIPAGTTVQSSAYSLHHTPEVFPDPFEWKPERWLEASPSELSTMKHWFWAFSSGPRMCIGGNFAFYCKSMFELVSAYSGSDSILMQDTLISNKISGCCSFCQLHHHNS
jgi:cytochrome P450